MEGKTMRRLKVGLGVIFVKRIVRKVTWTRRGVHR
jgi:hypothetical protein